MDSSLLFLGIYQRLHKQVNTLVEDVIILREDEAPSHRNHEVLISALNNHSTLTNPHPLFDRVRNLRTPNPICIINYMIHPIFLCQLAKLIYLIWHPRSEATSC